MLSSTKRPGTWRASPSALRRRVTARPSLLWLIATAALLALCLASFLAWTAQDRSVTLTPVSSNRGSAPPDDPYEDRADEDRADEDRADEAPAEEWAAEESASSVLPIVVSGASGFGGLLSGVAAMMTVQQAADKGTLRQSPGAPHGRLPEHRRLDRTCGCRRA